MSPRAGGSRIAYRVHEETGPASPWNLAQACDEGRGDLQQLNEARFLAAFCCAVFGERDPRQVCATAAQWLHRYFGYREANFLLSGAGLGSLCFDPGGGCAPVEGTALLAEKSPVLPPRVFSVPETRDHDGLEITVQFPAGQGSLRLREAEMGSPAASPGFLEGIVECLGAALEKACEYQELQELSLRDGLTGLLNRRAFEELLEFEEDRREDRPYAMIMIDIDNFKQINDGHGHPAGDRVIAAVAGVIREALRGADLATRYGGEEFSVLLPGTAARDALGVAERIRGLVEGLVFDFAPGGVRVTVSLGVAGRNDKQECGLKALLALADQALYRAKRSGKNLSIMHQLPARCAIGSAAVDLPA